MERCVEASIHHSRIRCLCIAFLFGSDEYKQNDEAIGRALENAAPAYLFNRSAGTIAFLVDAVWQAKFC